MNESEIPKWEWTGYDYQVAFVKDGYLYKGDYRIKIADLELLPKPNPIDEAVKHYFIESLPKD